jgi:hypothetical protein
MNDRLGNFGEINQLKHLGFVERTIKEVFIKLD